MTTEKYKQLQQTVESIKYSLYKAEQEAYASTRESVLTEEDRFMADSDSLRHLEGAQMELNALVEEMNKGE